MHQDSTVAKTPENTSKLHFLLFRILRYRKSLIAAALTLTLITIFYLFFGRVTFVSDLGTNGKVRVKLSAPSPWLADRKFFIDISNSTRPNRDGTVIRCYRSEHYRNNVPIYQNLWVILDAREETESTVSDFIAVIESEISGEGIKAPVLEYGDPNTPIGRHFDKIQRSFFSPDWGLFQIGKKNIWFPRLFSKGETETF